MSANGKANCLPVFVLRQEYPIPKLQSHRLALARTQPGLFVVSAMAATVLVD